MRRHEHIYRHPQDPVTIFRDQYAKQKEVRHWTLAEMREEFLKTRAPTKKKLPWLKMADFGTNAMPKSGSLGTTPTY